jgi:hypothetical protein
MPVANDLLARALEFGDARDIHAGYHYLGDAALLQNDPAAAEPSYREALRWALAYGDQGEATVEMQGVAMALAGQGQTTLGGALASAAAAKQRDLGYDISGVTFWVTLLERYIGSPMGDPGDNTLTFDHALDHSLSEQPRPTLDPAIDPGPGDIPILPVGASFVREGEYWTVSYDGALSRVKDSKGMRILARLLANPGTEIHALDLTGSPSAIAQTEGGPGDILDPRARAAYKARLHDLSAEVDEATAWNDAERAARARAEIDTLVEALSAAVGIGGRARRTGTAAERARVGVTRALRDSLRRIAATNPALGSHLGVSIHTGTFCSYAPDPRARVDWTV